MDSDSSDDEVFVTAFPSKRKRNDDKKVAKNFSKLKAYMAVSDKMAEQQNQIAQLAQQNKCIVEDDATMMANIDKSIAEARAPKTKNRDREEFISGVWEDLENVLPKEVRKLWGSARDTDMDSGLGVRDILDFDPSRLDNNNDKDNKNSAESVQFDAASGKLVTTKDYVRQLKAILKTLVSNQNKALQTAWIQPLRVKSGGSEFTIFLEENMLSRRRHEFHLKTIPSIVLVWLFRVACSPDQSDSPCVNIREGAFQSLLALLRQNKALQSSMNEEEITQQKPHFLALSQMARQLENWVPLAKVESTKEKENENPKDQGEMKSNRVENAIGLKRWLEVWNTAFDCQQVSATADTVQGAKEASNCLILLTKAGLARCFHSSQRTFRLKQHLRSTISSLLQFVKFHYFEDEEQHFLTWMAGTAKAVVKQLNESELGPGGEGAEDKDDTHAFLCFALLLRVLPTTGAKVNWKFQQSAAEFKAMLCLETLEHFFMPSAAKAWKNQVFLLVSKCLAENKDEIDLVENAKTSLHWLCLCSALAAILQLNDMKDDILDQPTKCLATVEIALGSCLEVGMALCKRVPVKPTTQPDEIRSPQGPLSPSPKKAETNEYHTVEEARAIACFLGLLVVQCKHLAARVGASAMNPHFSRTSLQLQFRKKDFTESLENSARLGGVKELVQKSIDGWLKKDQTSKSCNAMHSDDEQDVDPDSENQPESPAKKQKAVFGGMRINH